jgi:hypothetical protein
MKRFLIIAAIVAFVVIELRLAQPGTIVRYRLTLDATVDGVPHTGSGVAEVRYSKVMLQGPATNELDINKNGQAVILDLGPRGIVFCLLNQEESGAGRLNGNYIVPKSFGLEAVPRPLEKGLSQIRSLQGKVDVPLNRLPTLARFQDLNDPASVQEVDPMNIAKTFGAGAVLTKATIEIVSQSEPLSTGIKKILPWLPEYFDKNLDGRRYETINAPNRFANSVSSGSFTSAK